MNLFEKMMGGQEQPKEQDMMTPEQWSESEKAEIPPAVRAVMEKKEAGETLTPEEEQLVADYEEGMRLQKEFGNQSE